MLSPMLWKVRILLSFETSVTYNFTPNTFVCYEVVFLRHNWEIVQCPVLIFRPVACLIIRLKLNWQLTKATTEMKYEH